MWQTVLTIFYVLWLCAVLALLWLIWRNGVRYTMRLEQTLINAALKASDAAQKAAESAHALVEKLGHAN
jgi:hypothetical protein